MGDRGLVWESCENKHSGLEHQAVRVASRWKHHVKMALVTGNLLLMVGSGTTQAVYFDVWECLLSRFRSAMEFAQGGGREAGGKGNELFYHLAKVSSF